MKLNFKPLAFIILIGFASCNKNNDPMPVATTAAISGAVNLYDEGTTQLEKSGMTVKVDGSNPVISATTDTSGKFTLANVPFGTYTLVFEKSGFGTFKKSDVEHTNTGSSTFITEAPSLGKESTTQVTNLEVVVNGNNVKIAITTNPAGNNSNTRYVRYFLATDSNVSSENYTFNSANLVSKINPFETTITRDNLVNAGFTSGQTVYVKAYGDSFWSNDYDDKNLARKIFPNLNKTSANSVSFIVP